MQPIYVACFMVPLLTTSTNVRITSHVLIVYNAYDVLYTYFLLCIVNIRHCWMIETIVLCTSDFNCFHSYLLGNLCLLYLLYSLPAAFYTVYGSRNLLYVLYLKHYT